MTAHPNDRADADDQLAQGHLAMPNMPVRRRGQPSAPKAAPKEWKDLTGNQLKTASSFYKLRYPQHRLVLSGNKDHFINGKLDQLSPFSTFWPLPVADQQAPGAGAADGSNALPQEGDGGGDEEEEEEENEEAAAGANVPEESDDDEEEGQPQILLPFVDEEDEEDMPGAATASSSGGGGSSSSSSSSSGRVVRIRAPFNHPDDLVRCICGCLDDVCFRDTRPCSGCYSNTFNRVSTRCVSRSYFCEICSEKEENN